MEDRIEDKLIELIDRLVDEKISVNPEFLRFTFYEVRVKNSVTSEEEKGNRMSKLEKITFRPEGEEPVEFYVLEQTRIGGHNYILVTDVEEGDGDALILKDMSQDGEEESIYDVVSDDEELEAVSGVFADMLEDVDLI